MKTELLYLVYVTVFTGLLWVPYILDRIATRGLLDAVGYPENPKPQSPWAQRLIKAHFNAAENLVVFAALGPIRFSGTLLCTKGAAFSAVPFDPSH